MTAALRYTGAQGLCPGPTVAHSKARRSSIAHDAQRSTWLEERLVGKPPSTLKQVTKVLGGIYGSSQMCRGLAKHIDENIEDWRQKSNEDESLEHLVRLQIWNWYAGGDTALYAAQQVMKIYDAH